MKNTKKLYDKVNTPGTATEPDEFGCHFDGQHSIDPWCENFENPDNWEFPTTKQPE